MAILFAGGEDSDFTRIGTCSVDTATTAARRTANARCSLRVGASGGGQQDGWMALFAPQTSVWVGAWVYPTNLGAGNEILCLLDGTTGTRRIVVQQSSNFYQLVKRNDANAETVLVTTSVTPAYNTLYKVDLQVINYGAGGTVNFYVGGSLIMSYTGNIMTDAATYLSGVIFGTYYYTGANYWSECIVSTTDTRSMSLVTLAPNGAGNAFTFTGAYTDINEVTMDDSTIATSATAGQIAQTTITTTGVTGSAGIVALVTNARAMKGLTGPTKANFMVRTGGTDYSTTDIALPTSLRPISYAWETNPATGVAWTNANLTAAGFNVGIKSVA